MSLIIFLLPLLMQVCLVTCRPQEGPIAPQTTCQVYEHQRIEFLGVPRVPKDCQFPFVYKGQTFESCTDFDEDDGPWCSTRTDPVTNEHIDKKGYWGLCNDTEICPSPPAEGQPPAQQQQPAEIRIIDFPTNPSDPEWKPQGEECGGKTVFTHIYGGRSTRLGEKPYNVLLGYKKPGDAQIRYACGGSLINAWYVLTASHCVDDTSKEQLGDLVEIVLGEHDKRTDPDANNSETVAKAIRRKPANITLHEDYHVLGRVNLQNDIALIKVNEIIPLYGIDGRSTQESTASPVCLPWRENDPGRDLKHDTKLTVTGWGKTESGQSADVLQQVDVPYQDEEVCTDEFQRFGLTIDSSTQMCAGGEHGKDSCNGDSGGPLAFQKRPSEPWFQVGIVSFGTRYCAIGTPAIYTRVEAYLDWIASNMVQNLR